MLLLCEYLDLWMYISLEAPGGAEGDENAAPLCFMENLAGPLPPLKRPPIRAAATLGHPASTPSVREPPFAEAERPPPSSSCKASCGHTSIYTGSNLIASENVTQGLHFDHVAEASQPRMPLSGQGLAASQQRGLRSLLCGVVTGNISISMEEEKKEKEKSAGGGALLPAPQHLEATREASAVDGPQSSFSRFRALSRPQGCPCSAWSAEAVRGPFLCLPEGRPSLLLRPARPSPHEGPVGTWLPVPSSALRQAERGSRPDSRAAGQAKGPGERAAPPPSGRHPPTGVLPGRQMDWSSSSKDGACLAAGGRNPRHQKSGEDSGQARVQAKLGEGGLDPGP